jgi:hypothetical protein
MYKYLIVAVCSFTALKTTAQKRGNLGQEPKRFNFYVNASFGYYFPFNTTKAIASRGGNTGFQFQANYKDHLFTRLFFDQTSVKYEDAFSVNGLNTNIREKVNTTSVGFDFGYTFHITPKFASFVYAGGGYATMDVPKISYQPIGNNLNIQTNSRSFFNFRSGLGLEYEFSKIFILYTDFQYSSIPFKTDISEKKLYGLNIQIGFKTPLQ